MDEAKKQKSDRWAWVKERYRLVLMHDETFEEARSVRLTPLNVFIGFGILILLVISIVFSLLAFTPLRRLLPTNESVSSNQELRALYEQVDSLRQQVENQTLYLNTVRARIFEEFEYEEDVEAQQANQQVTEREGSIPDKSDAVQEVIASAESEAALRKLRSSEFASDQDIEQMTFLAPIRGMVSDSFMPERKHFGTDIVAPKDSPIKAVLAGTVILATWSSDTGHMIGIQHSDNVVSFYKHNSAVLKKEGDFVKAGEAIAVIGNTGEMSSGPHLHFELWHKGQPVNPEDYIKF